jgi:predicted DNA-binding protein (MmcQ/YjbR family)
MASVAKAHAACKALPGTTYDVKWGKDECYSVGGKMFAVIGPGGTHGGPAGAAWSIGFKVDDFRFLELTDRDGIIPAPYMAKHKWVLVQDPKKVGDTELKELIARSHALILSRLPKRLQAKLAAEPAAQKRRAG